MPQLDRFENVSQPLKIRSASKYQKLLQELDSYHINRSNAYPKIYLISMKSTQQGISESSGNTSKGKCAHQFSQVLGVLRKYNEKHFNMAQSSSQVDLVLTIYTIILSLPEVLRYLFFTYSEENQLTLLLSRRVGLCIMLLCQQVRLRFDTKSQKFALNIWYSNQLFPLFLCLLIFMLRIGIEYQSILLSCNAILCIVIFFRQYLLVVDQLFPQKEFSIWLVCTGLLFLKYIIYPESFQQSDHSLDYLLLSSLCLIFCVSSTYYRHFRLPSNQIELFPLYYRIIHTFQLIGMCSSPFYNILSLSVTSMMLLLSLISITVQLKFKTKVFLLKFFYHSQKSIVKIRNNEVLDSDSGELAKRRLQLSSRSIGKTETAFYKETCCKCCCKRATVLGNRCKHISLCIDCVKSEQRKQKIQQYELVCPLCSNRSSQFYELNERSEDELLGTILNQRINYDYVPCRYPLPKKND